MLTNGRGTARTRNKEALLSAIASQKANDKSAHNWATFDLSPCLRWSSGQSPVVAVGTERRRRSRQNPNWMSRWVSGSGTNQQSQPSQNSLAD